MPFCLIITEGMHTGNLGGKEREIEMVKDNSEEIFSGRSDSLFSLPLQLWPQPRFLLQQQVVLWKCTLLHYTSMELGASKQAYIKQDLSHLKQHRMRLLFVRKKFRITWSSAPTRPSVLVTAKAHFLLFIPEYFLLYFSLFVTSILTWFNSQGQNFYLAKR